jgi:hypothetical protein
MLNSITQNFHSIGNGIEQRLKKWDLKEQASLSYKEADIFRQIQSRVTSALGVPVKLFDGTPQETSRGLALFSTGFTSTDISSPFVICHRMLAGLAENENALKEFMQRLDGMIENQRANDFSQSSMNEHIAQRQTERTSHQIRVSMMAMMDFWNESRAEGRSLTQPVQAQSMKKVADLYTTNLAGGMN